MTNPIGTKTYLIEAQHRFCPARWCASGAWLVQRDAHLPHLWQITEAVGGGAWTVAATEPVCPRCGTTLCTTLELDGGFGGDDILQPGRMLNWPHTL
jgi:ribosomal protein S27AE